MSTGPGHVQDDAVHVGGGAAVGREHLAEKPVDDVEHRVRAAGGLVDVAVASSRDGAGQVGSARRPAVPPTSHGSTPGRGDERELAGGGAPGRSLLARGDPARRRAAPPVAGDVDRDTGRLRPHDLRPRVQRAVGRAAVPTLAWRDVRSDGSVTGQGSSVKRKKQTGQDFCLTLDIKGL